MAFTAKDVMRLREMTGVGMMDCKKALTDAEGDFDRAIELLREKGLAAAAKKASRIAAEGVVYAYVAENGDAAMVEVNSETDFVARNPEFQNFVENVAKVANTAKPADVEALASCAYPEGGTVEDARKDKVLTIGENIQVRRFVTIPGGEGILNDSYIHMGGKIGVIVTLKTEGIDNKDALTELAHDIALQAAAMNPQWLNQESVPAETVAKEKEILMAQTMEEGKPENVAARIVEGRIKKFYQENCLIEQAFVKENKISVNQHVANVAKELGGSIEVSSFVRFEKGEGLAKREENFAEEIAKLAK
ncbi:MAG: elongation factor Ts [Clostridiaceae bacterium]|nr:elongation factor Ts [Clostridiaceae bacterium]MDD6273568.1 translation elongation factor Ts [Clostridiaceae bacterium]